MPASPNAVAELAPSLASGGFSAMPMNVNSGRTSQPESRSKITEANAAGRFPVSAATRVTRRTSPPMVVGIMSTRTARR